MNLPMPGEGRGDVSLEWGLTSSGLFRFLIFPYGWQRLQIAGFAKFGYASVTYPSVFIRYFNFGADKCSVYSILQNAVAGNEKATTIQLKGKGYEFEEVRTSEINSGKNIENFHEVIVSYHRIDTNLEDWSGNYA